MLVMTRKESERIFVGDNIVITVVRIDDGRVRIGVAGPGEVPVYREELYRRIFGDEKADQLIVQSRGKPDAAA